MYGYEEYIDISPEQLLQKVTQQEIFEFVLQRPFSFSSRYISPFRDDKKPGCRFEERPDGTIIFVDWGERFRNPTKIHRSAFGAVMDKFGLTLSGAVRVICVEFGLSTSARDYEAISLSSREYRSDEPTVITYIKTPYKKIDIIEWSRFLIKIDHLLEDNVFATNRFYVKKEGKWKTINVYKYCYAIDFIERVKIYQPYSEKYKFITNCTENDIGNFDNLPPTGDEVIIKKSYKDHRVLRNLDMGLNVIWLHNEGCIPELEILRNLVERFKLITIFFDNDEAGVLAALKLYEIFNSIREGCVRIVHLPIFLSRKLTHKDPSGFINKEGRVDLITVLKQIGIYGNT